MSDLEETGERFHPSMRGVIRYEHMHRYALCLDLVEGCDVLDIASGEGYGSMLLASRAKRVVGVDVDSRAVEHARHSYYRPNVRFLVGDCTEMPVADASFDVVVSFETIEHIEEHDRMLSEVRRVLRPGGRLVISSPNKLVYSDDVRFSNPFHVHELYYDEFVRLLERHFACVRVHGQRLAAASFVYPLVDRLSGGLASYGTNGGEAREGMPPLERPLYFIAVCGDDPESLGAIDSLFVDTHDDVLQTLQEEHERALHQISVQQRALSEVRERAEMLAAAEPEPLRLEAAAPDPDGAQRRLDELTAERDRLAQALDALRVEANELRAERDTASALRHAEREELEALRVQQHTAGGLSAEAAAIAADRDSVAAHRDAIAADRDAIAAHRDAVVAHSGTLQTERDAALADAAALQAERDAAVAEWEAHSAELEALRNERNRWLDERDLSAHHAALLERERDVVIAERDALREQDDALRRQYEALLAERDALLAERDALVEERGALDRVERERAELHADCTRLQRRTDTMARELEALRERLDAANGEIGDLRARRGELSAAVRRLLDLIAVYEAQIAALAAERTAADAAREARAQRALQHVLGSRSWKMTAPLRRVARAVRRNRAGNG
jgi:SAM-dependent methyltransferase/chromosome segregation ATPase